MIWAFFNPRPSKGGLSEPPKVFCKNDIEMKFWIIVNGLMTNL